MPPPQGLFSFPGIESVVSAEYTLNHGISPGVCLMTIVPQRTLPTEAGTLTISFDGNKIRFPNCIPDQATFELNEQGELWRLSIFDRRWSWQTCGELHGRYNLRLPNELDLLEKVELLDFPTEKTPRELLELCLKGMKEKGYSIKADLQNVEKYRPQIEWDYSNPATELARLCDLFGLRVVYGLDDKVSIHSLGKGQELPDGKIIHDAGGNDVPEIPRILVFVGGPTRAQADIRIEAVGLDVDGRVKPINDLSYKPAGGWSASNPPYFSDMQDNWRTRELARQTVFRWYRVHDNPQGPDGKPLKVIGQRALDFGEPLPDGGGFEVKERWQLLPLSDQQTLIVETKESGLQMYQRPLVYGIFVTGKTNSSDLGNNYDLPSGQTFPPRFFSTVDPITGNTFPRGGDTTFNGNYQIDHDRGIVIFDRTVYKLSSSNRPEPAILILRTGCVVRDQKYRTPHRQTLARPLPSKNDTEPYLVRDDDLFLILRPKALTQQVDNPELGDYEPLTREFESNLKDFEKQADALLDTMQKKFQDVKTRSRIYAGFIEIEPDGAIQQVSWRLTEDGAETHASRNGELAVPSLSYRERRFYERQAGPRAEKLGDAAAQIFQAITVPGTARNAIKGGMIV